MRLDEEDEHDWEVTADGLYMATRGFLMRRGYCCANQCRNCPYINWRKQATWRPVPAHYVHRLRVSPKAIAGIYALLDYHEQLLEDATNDEQHDHQSMIAHYRFLLEQWNTSK